MLFSIIDLVNASYLFRISSATICSFANDLTDSSVDFFHNLIPAEIADIAVITSPIIPKNFPRFTARKEIPLAPDKVPAANAEVTFYHY